MWIYYYACFGPGHQSNDYGFKYFHNGYDTESIKDHLFGMLSNHDDIVLDFWEVKNPSADHVGGQIQIQKEKIKSCRKYLKMLQQESCFVPDEKEGEDPVLIRNMRDCIDHKLLERLHKAGFMYSVSDISNWRRGKKSLAEPSRTKILNIMRKTKKYPPINKKVK